MRDNTVIDEQILSIGSLRVTASAARRAVTIYTTPARTIRPTRHDFYAWPYYDRLQTGAKASELCDGDLLAPALLNANPGIHGFAGLQRLRSTLEQRLTGVPANVDLADAS